MAARGKTGFNALSATNKNFARKLGKFSRKQISDSARRKSVGGRGGG